MVHFQLFADFFLNHSFVLSLAEVDAELMMEEESLVWTSKDVVIVLEHNNKMIPLRYVELLCTGKFVLWMPALREF
jgi:hypothetical protein